MERIEWSISEMEAIKEMRKGCEGCEHEGNCYHQQNLDKIIENLSKSNKTLNRNDIAIE